MSVLSGVVTVAGWGLGGGGGGVGVVAVVVVGWGAAFLIIFDSGAN